MKKFLKVLGTVITWLLTIVILWVAFSAIDTVKTVENCSLATLAEVDHFLDGTKSWNAVNFFKEDIYEAVNSFIDKAKTAAYSDAEAELRQKAEEYKEEIRRELEAEYSSESEDIQPTSVVEKPVRMGNLKLIEPKLVRMQELKIEPKLVRMQELKVS